MLGAECFRAQGVILSDLCGKADGLQQYQGLLD